MSIHCLTEIGIYPFQYLILSLTVLAELFPFPVRTWFRSTNSRAKPFTAHSRALLVSQNCESDLAREFRGRISSSVFGRGGKGSPCMFRRSGTTTACVLTHRPQQTSIYETNTDHREFTYSSRHRGLNPGPHRPKSAALTTIPNFR